MPNRLADHLTGARRALFVGRSRECAIFQAAIDQEQFNFQVLHLSGSGGVGKTALLHQFRSICETRAIPVAMVDARNFEATSEAFLNVLALVLSSAPETLMVQLGITESPLVIIIDSFDDLAPLDGWLRDEFLPQLTERILVVLAGKQPLPAPWQADDGWQQVVYRLPLRNLAADESRDYLTRRGYPEAAQQSVIDFTHGYPLALSLVSDLYTQNGAIVTLDASPDIVQVLLARLVQDVPSPAHRAALELCALARITTRSLLSAVIQRADDSHELFDWLRSLSFIQNGSRGVFPHDLARAALAADLRWRDPDWYAEMGHRARTYLNAQVRQTSGIEQQRALHDLGYLHRNNPTIESFIEWGANDNLLTELAQPADWPAILDMVERFEGVAAAGIACHWLQSQPENTVVLRDKQNEVTGFMTTVSLRQTTSGQIERDPATRIACDYLQSQVALAQNDEALFFRFWMARDSYQQVSEVQSLLFLQAVKQYISTEGLAFTFFPCADVDFWAAAFAYANIHRLPEADYCIGGRDYGVFSQDWRQVTPLAWLESVAMPCQRSENSGSVIERPGAESLHSHEFQTMPYSEFATGVQMALRSLGKAPGHTPAWANNALLESCVVRRRLGAKAHRKSEQVAVLQEALREACDALKNSPREEKFYNALHHTYLSPAPSQEQAAILMDVPFSSFRRYLKAGVSRVTDYLWQRELETAGFNIASGQPHD